MTSQYAEANIREFFINSNIDEVLGSLELNAYIENIKKDGEYAGIIELSIASKIFSINIYVYIDKNNDNEFYELYEKIEKEKQKLPIYYLLYENGNEFSL